VVEEIPLSTKFGTMATSLRKRIFAWTMKQGDPDNHRTYAPYKKDLFKNVKGSVLEIGPGSGINFNYLPAGIQWAGLEPNPAFHKVLLSKAKEKQIEASVLHATVDQVPLPDESVDNVICTLVLCSVKNVAAALAEMKRVMRKDGKLLFIEHVAAKRKTWLRLQQNIFNPLNRLMYDGCNCNRETWNYIQNAGFSKVEYSLIMFDRPMEVATPHIVGYAIK
jgi:ubiquinone/menaquinone biosynthesis C-methylase UbiE